MANEEYEEEGHEEGEYHFSDDQINYDMEMNPSAKESAAAIASSPKESIVNKLSQHRRVVIGLLVFIVLLGIVFKLVSPSNPPVTDFQPGAPANAPASMPVKKAVAPPPAPVITQPRVPEQQPAMQTTVTTTTTQPVVQQQSAMPQQAVPAQQQMAPVATTAGTAPTPQADRNITERIGTLEQQSTEMMNLMQTQYAQKIADTELQNTQLKAQVQELTARISNMEVAFRQLTKILRNNAGANTASASSGRVMSGAPQAARVAQPRNAYTVQAIIPGRAWLKSDSGDTVTVAEGDILKGYGRITRIDPYDGVVDIDTGNRVVSLSYGMTGD